MGIGDQLMASGFARGARARGKMVAFGDGKRIIWDQHSADIFRGNQNIAAPGMEPAPNLEWVPFYKGNRQYNTHDRVRNRWIWNMEFRPRPGEVVLDGKETNAAMPFGKGYVVIEPNVPEWKASATNKQWSVKRYVELARRLLADGHDVRQFAYGGRHILPGVRQMRAKSFRMGLAILRNARLYVGPEGGMHHGAAAMNVPAVVLFGGWIPPRVTGYDMHVNLAHGDEFCGLLGPCQHCRAAMDQISLEQVEAAVRAKLAA